MALNASTTTSSTQGETDTEAFTQDDERYKDDMVIEGAKNVGLNGYWRRMPSSSGLITPFYFMMRVLF
jgi:hypothetical protein